ncbi:hypothetical protein [Streptomyces sp. RKAG337]|uniref:hypothetical protein n=1 Tax=Streptomyces sp. RKAG337 TaxID=2893404 RepID=UPI002033B318|nr:hypothetical protein [Streptomyces sp. RKAG337]MCM2426185.1 hypothetical protein [Streptomyces sp. RKAG337]
MSPRNTAVDAPEARVPADAVFPGDAAAVAAYRDQRRLLQKEAVLGRGELIESVLRGRRAALAGLRATPWLRRLIDITHRQVRQVMARPEYADVLPLRRSMLTFLAELPLPIPADSVILRHPTHAPAAEILAGLPELRHRRAEVTRILAESSLQETGTPFRTVDDDSGRAIVLGQDAPTIDALAGIAHELGHCLYERARPGRSVRSQFASERLAHCLEERLVAAYLRERGSPEECRDWWSYQRRVDAHNLYFFRLERALMYEQPDSVPELMPESTTSFRESLFILPGYQVVYARASLARLPAHGGA